MRIIKEISIQQIDVDNYSISKETLDIVDYIRSGGEIPEIKVINLDSGRFKLKDGRHRITAYKLLGKQKIKAKFSTKKINKMEKTTKLTINKKKKKKQIIDKLKYELRRYAELANRMEELMQERNFEADYIAAKEAEIKRDCYNKFIRDLNRLIN